MKKIMFSDKYGFTGAVLQGRKTMTRRLVGNRMTEDDIRAYLKGYTELANKCAQYKKGEVVAVAQSYKDIIHPLDWVNMEIYGNKKGWSNKMFVLADLMPHQIRITDVKVERLQDITDEDCLREGVAKFDYGFFVPKLYRIPSRGVEYAFRTPREAFAALIDKVSGKGTWERNPWVFVYSFELIK